MTSELYCILWLTIVANSLQTTYELTSMNNAGHRDPQVYSSIKQLLYGSFAATGRLV